MDLVAAPLILLSIFAWISPQDLFGIAVLVGILWLLWDEFFS